MTDIEHNLVLHRCKDGNPPQAGAYLVRLWNGNYHSWDIMIFRDVWWTKEYAGAPQLWAELPLNGSRFKTTEAAEPQDEYDEPYVEPPHEDD